MIKKIFVAVVISCLTLVSIAQTINPASVDVSALSDSQIQQIISEMQKRGMTEEQALALARAKGVSEEQISMLRERLLSVTADGSISRSSDTGLDLDNGMSSDFLFGSQNEFSEKPFFMTTPEEESLFGFRLFNSENLTFEPNATNAITDDYIIGVGDEFRVDIYGASQQSYVAIVDKTGQISIPNIGPIAVGSRSFRDAKKILREKLALIYRDLVAAVPETFVNIHLGAIQPITVNVIGEVFAPGTYTLPGNATAFNALYLSGGPNIRGSFRDIRIIRNSKIVHRLDVYDYLINGNGAVNVPLNDGDVVMVPTYHQRVRVGGELIRTGIFETEGTETIKQLIDFAGGFNEKAFRERVELHRNNGRQLEVKDVAADTFEMVTLQNGDSIYVGKVLDRFVNRVRIEGAVFRPGTYELTKGLKLSELIARADGLREDAFMERGVVSRLKEDLSPVSVAFSVTDVVNGNSDMLLSREDVVTIRSIDEMREKRVVHIRGEVQTPGVFDYMEEMSLGDLIMMAGGFKEVASESYIEVTRRLSYEEAEKTAATVAQLFQFSIPRNLSLKNKDAAFELMPFDEVYVRMAPGAIKEGSIRISGEVMHAGEYALVKKNERLSDLINRSGGFTAEAYLPGAMLTRPIVLTAKERRLREFAKSKNEGLETPQMEFEVVGVDLARAIKQPGGRDDIYLRDGDELVVPRRSQTIQVGGGVLNPLSMPYIEGRGVKYYVKSSGGFALRAKRNRVYVVYPNGSAGATSSFLGLRSYPRVLPGSEIVVPQKPEKDMPVSAWIAIGSGISTIALTLATLINLLN
ncbi:SLBB domain-containing protein [Geofilum sp. OHC36d9]|uniref:SLBB domain-containing protein n=1 Tax=Geofilum sp. OHC36d9 TaxID=3458413 RepID=UPI0040333C5E